MNARGLKGANGAGVTGIEVSAPGISGNTVNNATYGITLDDSAAGAKVTSPRFFQWQMGTVLMCKLAALPLTAIIGKSG